jgi:hypothetical protein
VIKTADAEKLIKASINTQGIIEMKRSFLIQKNYLDDLVLLFDKEYEKYMIEKAFFFSKDVVDRAFSNMRDDINNHNPIPVRQPKSQKKHEIWIWNSCYEASQLKNIKVCSDHDGNAAVRKLIKKLTGNVISQGVKSNIKYARLSHIWGETSNPLFFTSLWNVVVVPSFLNDVLDKSSSSDIRVESIKEKFKSICWNRYDVKTKLKTLGLSESEISQYKPKTNEKHHYKIQELTSIMDSGTPIK